MQETNPNNSIFPHKTHLPFKSGGRPLLTPPILRLSRSFRGVVLFGDSSFSANKGLAAIEYRLPFELLEEEEEFPLFTLFGLSPVVDVT